MTLFAVLVVIFRPRHGFWRPLDVRAGTVEFRGVGEVRVGKVTARESRYFD